MNTVTYSGITMWRNTMSTPDASGVTGCMKRFAKQQSVCHIRCRQLLAVVARCDETMVASGVNMVYVFLMTSFVFLGHNIFERCHIRVNKFSDFFFFFFGANYL